jgi:hypothetical protein
MSNLTPRSGYSEVTTAEGAQTAASWGCAFVECSAKYQEFGSTGNELFFIPHLYVCPLIL